MEWKPIPRGRNPRTIRCDPEHTYFKPRGIPLSEITEEVVITLEELETLRLTALERLSQQDAGRKMNISQSTVSRHLDDINRKLAKALVEGLAIRIANPKDFYHCDNCGYTWLLLDDLKNYSGCIKCGSTKFHLHKNIKKSRKSAKKNDT
ncbi:MAG: DUF134 domain-containing protein [Candidatus Hodarchaeales archaeon]